MHFCSRIPLRNYCKTLSKKRTGRENRPNCSRSDGRNPFNQLCLKVDKVMGRDIGILHTQGLRTWGTNKRNWHEVLDYETCGDAKYQKCLSFWKSQSWWVNVFLFFFLQVFQVKWNCYFGFGRKKQWNRRRKSKMTWTSCLSQSLDRKCQQVCYVQGAVNAGTHQVTGCGDLLSQW